MSFVGVTQVQGRVPVTVLHLQDRVNLGNVAEVEQAARQAYEQGARHLLIDLADAPSITSAGLRALLIIYRLFEGSEPKDEKTEGLGRSRHVKLLNLTPEVRMTLQIAGFDRFFESHVDLGKAIASF